MGISNAIYRTSGLPSSETLFPTPAEVFFKGFLWFHDKWKWIRLGEIYTDESKFLHIAAGEGLYQLVGKSSIIRTASVAVLISTRILHCTKQYEKLEHSCNGLLYALDNSFPAPIECDWDQDTYRNVFSVSTIIWIKSSTKALLIRIQNIVVAVLKVGKHTFLMAMRLADAVEAFSFSTEVKKEGVRFFFVNISDWVTNLSENRGLLLDGLRSNQQLLETVLKGVGSNMTGDELITSVESIMDKAEDLDQSVQNASRSIIDFLTACCKKWGYEFLKEVGLHHLVPKSMIPPPSLVRPLPDPENKSERFPPTEWITKPRKEIQTLTKISLAVQKRDTLRPTPISYESRGSLGRAKPITPPPSPQKKITENFTEKKK